MAATLNAIRQKVRRLTRSPSEAQLTTAELDEYVNTFILYDMPEHLRLFDLKTTFTFYTEPYQDVYTSDVASPNPLDDFKNLYTSFTPPLYIAGYQSMWTQSREQFFGIYPKVNSIASIGSQGDGVTTAFTGTLSAVPVLRNEVLFSSVDDNNNGVELYDDGNGVLSDTTGTGSGTIDYVSGAYSLNFAVAPGSGIAINSQTVPYVPALPQALCYFDNKFILRPVPDQPYRVQMEAYFRPLAILDGGSMPELEQWWQYFAYGAARKVFQDRMDLESLAQIEPEFNLQQRLVLRKTLVINANQRSATIYTEQTNIGVNGYGVGWGNGPF